MGILLVMAAVCLTGGSKGGRRWQQQTAWNMPAWDLMEQLTCIEGDSCWVHQAWYMIAIKTESQPTLKCTVQV